MRIIIALIEAVTNSMEDVLHPFYKFQAVHNAQSSEAVNSMIRRIVFDPGAQLVPAAVPYIQNVNSIN